jgi:hypothetical protein
VSGILFYFVQAFACGALGHTKVSQDNEQFHYFTNAAIPATFLSNSAVYFLLSQP